VVKLVRNDAGAGQVASATVEAAGKNLRAAANDPDVVEAVWLLVRLPWAARSDDFAAALNRCGVKVGDAPGLFDIVGAVSDAIDANAAGRCRSDLGELAQAAVCETLNAVLHGHLDNLFGSSPAEVRAAFARQATVKQFGRLTHEFYSRFLSKALDTFVSRTVCDTVGTGQRFPTVKQHGEFCRQLDTHCREAAVIVERFAGEWSVKHNYESDGRIGREEVGRFAAHAATKLLDELRQRSAP
jgi:hypothetical protein